LTGFGLDARLELLDPDGRLAQLPLNEVKMVSFVREFAPNDAPSGSPGGPERLIRRTFSGRPRTEGLWLRLTFRDNDVLEGVAANDLSILEAQGIHITPPDMRSNTQRIYVPRLALSELQVLGVIGGPAAASKRKTSATPAESLMDLFPDLPPNGKPN
jgi:hypothetical protein